MARMVVDYRASHRAAGNERVVLGRVAFDALTESEVIDHVRAALHDGVGGRIMTPNIDILRQAARSRAVRRDLASAELVVADGLPLVWASRVAGTPLPARVAGSDLIWSLSGGLAEDGRSVYLLGGEPVRPRPTGRGVRECGAERAARRLVGAHPNLHVAGWASPRYGFDRTPALLEAVCADVVVAQPDVVYVGIGFPRQEQVISALRPHLPNAWFLGCGAAINFVAGDQVRAKAWMQRAGLEWLHRLSCEPRRLAGRYLRHDAPYALRLLTAAALTRLTPRQFS
jgi:N-acetylglucosaminyldiphosphoundecaprenol N-acetyl-beta-D-mannosaminyltransferase